MRKKFVFFILFGYLFNDGYLNDVIVNVLKLNLIVMVLGLMYGIYVILSLGFEFFLECYLEVYCFVKN